MVSPKLACCTVTWRHARPAEPIPGVPAILWLSKLTLGYCAHCYCLRTVTARPRDPIHRLCDAPKAMSVGVGESDLSGQCLIAQFSVCE